MIKRLIKHGNSAAVIIDRPILALLGIPINAQVRLQTNGRALVITACDELERKLEEAMNDDERLDRALKALLG